MWPPASVTDIDGVLAFYGVSPAVWGSFCHAVGDPRNDMRLLASLPSTMVAEAVSHCRLESGRRLSPVEAIQVGLIYRACSLLVHLSMGAPMNTWVDPNPWATSSGSTGATGATSPAPSTTTGDRKMKLSQVADQGDESEFTILPETKKAVFYSRYVTKVGGLPSDAEDASIEQISAIIRKVRHLGQPPYCDFAVFVPFAKKHLKAQKYQSFLLQEDGTFLSKMVPGPGCFSHWQACFRVMRTALVMTDVISLANLMEWEAHIERLSRQFPGCWGLIAAADDRGRGEHMSKTLAKLQLDMDKGGQPPLGWAPEEPWDIVWNRVLNDKEYWMEQVHVPAITWTARGSRGKPLTPMEELANNSLRGGAQALQPETEEAEPERGKGKNKARREARKRRLHADREELKHFRKGSKSGGGKGDSTHGGKGGHSEEACYAWNNGNGLCGNLPPGEPCKGKIPRKHKCTTCGSPGHPSKDCPSKKK